MDIPLVHTLYDTYARLHALLIKFPKSQRYTLGQTCSAYLLNVLEHILAAGGTSQQHIKRERLSEASAKLDTLRLLIRLAKDCGCLPNIIKKDARRSKVRRPRFPKRQGSQ